MRNKKAKKIRKTVYGTEYSPRHRSYVWKLDKGARVCIVADDKRNEYQKLKGRRM